MLSIFESDVTWFLLDYRYAGCFNITEKGVFTLGDAGRHDIKIYFNIMVQIKRMLILVTSFKVYITHTYSYIGSIINIITTHVLLLFSYNIK